ncbi:MAG: XRE family transcriptional regulator [Burkholderiales bacterium]|nr:XRE family transcriptional regulator [Burkholderiales bacterium]MDE2298180.1 XRE family transcriptional regulator [Burkholderiales bacterium]MDE2629186.1 XRE family transcriptional regulator [Burkholderiales bacterium]
MKPFKATADKSDVDANLWCALAETPAPATNRRARAESMRQIAAIVNESGWTWTRADAAGQCGVTQPRMSGLPPATRLRFSIDALVNIAAAIGRSARFDLQLA